MGMGFEDCWFQNFSADAVRLETGATNYNFLRGRFDTIGGYCFYVEASTHSFYGTISGVTWDNNGRHDNYSKGFIFLDGQTDSGGNKTYVALRDLHLEINGDLTQTYVPTGWSPAGSDTRGIIRLGVSTTAPGGLQHGVYVDHLWIPTASAAAPYSLFQITSANLAADNRPQHAAAVRLSGQYLHGVGGATAEANGTCKMIGGVNTAEQFPYGPGATGGSKAVDTFSYHPNVGFNNTMERSVSYFKGRALIDGLNLPSSSTVGAAGGGAALPATPVKYPNVYDEQGNPYKVAAYNP